jgi:hypothetical protein
MALLILQALVVAGRAGSGQHQLFVGELARSKSQWAVPC